jgi:hypothetical protein
MGANRLLIPNEIKSAKISQIAMEEPNFDFERTLMNLPLS